AKNEVRERRATWSATSAMAPPTVLPQVTSPQSGRRSAAGGTLGPVTTRPKVWTVVVGGGTGERFGRPKQYEDLGGGERVIDRSRRVAESVSEGVVVVVPPSDAEREGGVPGGPTRSAS